MKTDDISVYVPQVRPHNRLYDRKIFFMISSRPLLELSPEEVLLYDSIDGLRTIAELETMHPGACGRLLKWRDARIVELIPPITSPTRPHLVVIEPHMDDAVLSAGGRLLHRRGRSRITILSVVKWSNFTSYLLLRRNFFNVQDVTAVRQQESNLVAKLIGAEHHCLDWSDAAIRFWPAERWSSATVEKFSSAPQAFVKLFPNPLEVSRLADQLLPTLDALMPDELWIPMGLGDHIDHRTTRSACLRTLAEARWRFSGIPVSMYKDLPYAAVVGHAAQICGALVNCGTSLVRATEDITDVFEEKLRLVSVYASQSKLSYIESPLRKFAEGEAGAAGKFAEAYYRLEGPPSLPHECHLSRERRGLEKLHNDTRMLMRKGSKRRQLTVMALPSGQLGRWKSIKESLLRAFPNGDFRIYVSNDVAWQTDHGEEDSAAQDGNNKFKVKVVRGGADELGRMGSRYISRAPLSNPNGRPMAGCLCRASEPMQTLKKLINILVKSLLPLRRVLFARTLWDFCCVLNEHADLFDSGYPPAPQHCAI